jgi:hypothetical protein
MRQRLARLARRTADVHRETGSLRAAVRYLFKSVARKAPTAGAHLWAALRYRIGPGADRARLAAIHDRGRLAIAITVSGGLGDLIVIARCMRDLAATVEPFSFDVFAPAPRLAHWVFAAVPGFERAFHDTVIAMAGNAYDLNLRMNQMVVIEHAMTRWQRIRRAPLLASVIGTIGHSRRLHDLEPYIAYHPWLDNALARKAVFTGHDRRTFLHHLAGLDYGGDRLAIAADDAALARFGLAGRRFITIHNGFDTNFVIAGERATKCYPHFAAVAAGLKAARPDLLIVQIGTTTSEPIAGADLNLIGKTSLIEVAGLLRAATLHLDNEGGLVHLAACLGRRSLVVFGPTPSDYFGYPGNIAVDPLHCGGCWWIDRLWMGRCPRGLAEPECVFTQPPERVVALALDALAETAEDACPAGDPPCAPPPALRSPERPES